MTANSGQFQPTTNPTGTIIATARPMGTAGAINLTNPERDTDTLMLYGEAELTVKTLINMGVLSRNGATLTENYWVSMGAGPSGTDPRPFPV